MRISAKSLTCYLLGLNILTLTFLLFKQAYYPAAPSRMMSTQEQLPKNITYKFDDPDLALDLLAKLDIYSVVPEELVPSNNFTRLYSMYQGNDDYCERHREYFVNNTEEFFTKIKFVSNYWPNHKLRTRVFPAVGEDITIRKYRGKNKFNQDQFQLTYPYDSQIYVMWNLYYIDRQIGKQYSCLAQESNHIAGHDLIYRKDNASQALVRYAKKFESRPNCFNFNKYFPKTWVLTEKEQCEEFFEEFLSQRYQELKQERNIVYFRKIGANVHEGKGVFPVNDLEGEYIKDLYKNGELCGKIKDNNLIQYNVHNLLLVQNRKFGFRSFMLIASVNPLIAYYHDGYARLSLDTYDSKSNNTSTFVTNIGVNLKHTDFSNWTNQQIQDYTYWPLEKFANHLYDEGIVSDPEWLDNHLRKEFMKVKIHILRMAQEGFIKKSSVFELFGLDYVMDENLNLWFIEANSMPLIQGFTKHSTELLNRMLADQFEIVTGLLRSRMKRVILYVNKLTSEFGGEVPDLMERREEFKELIKNNFEVEFKPSANNTFYRIVDENYHGKERYSGLIEEECLAF